ncbi:ECF RNA polymerase sigma factor SigJ [compost metagenome]
MDSLLMKEDLSYAVLVMLQKLTPVERALFILREVLGYEHKEIAGVLNKSEANCRKMYSRIKQNLQQEHLKASPDQEVVEHLVACFIQASETGDFNPFIQQLAPDALLFSDGGGKVRAAIRPIVSKERISAFFHGIAAKGSLAGESRSLWVNGNKGFVLLRGGIPIIVISFEWNCHNQIQTLYMIVNPEKLKLHD